MDANRARPGLRQLVWKVRREEAGVAPLPYSTSISLLGFSVAACTEAGSPLDRTGVRVSRDRDGCVRNPSEPWKLSNQVVCHELEGFRGLPTWVTTHGKRTRRYRAMPITNLQEKFMHELSDIYDAETGSSRPKQQM
jgi:hypothetical protein